MPLSIMQRTIHLLVFLALKHNFFLFLMLIVRTKWHFQQKAEALRVVFLFVKVQYHKVFQNQYVSYHQNVFALFPHIILLILALLQGLRFQPSNCL